MALKTVLLLVAFVAACGGAVFVPLVGVVAYILDYHVSPTTQWWGESLGQFGVRFSLALGVTTALGTVLARSKLRYGPALFSRHEVLILLLLGWAWILTFLHPVQASLFVGQDVPALKLTKIVLFAMILTHVVTDLRSVNWVLWTFVAGVLFVAYQANTAPSWMFTGDGRLDNIGGPDFREANGLGAHLGACLAIIGIQFLRSRWVGKFVCTVAGVLSVNAIILTRSRGALVGLAIGAVAAVLAAPKRGRRAIIAGLVIVAVGAFALTDPGFWERAETVTAAEGERDFSAQSRIDIWVASLSMLAHHPEGVGPGNFQARIGDYTSEHPKRDAHNAYVLCWGELGVPGIALFMLILLSAFKSLAATRSPPESSLASSAGGLHLVSYAFIVGLTVFLGSCLTGSRLYAEGLWWFIVMPLCLSRASANIQEEARAARPPTAVVAPPARGRPRGNTTSGGTAERR